MEKLLANIITKNFFNIGEHATHIILSYMSQYKKIDFPELPSDWAFITVFANRYFYKLSLYEDKIELYFSCNKDLDILPDNIAFDFAIQYSIFRYCKYYKQMILKGYSVDADGFQEYFNEEHEFFINHFYIRTFFKFLTDNLSKFNVIMDKYEYLRTNKYFCKHCKELFESGSGRSCDCQLIDEQSSSEDEDTSNWETESLNEDGDNEDGDTEASTSDDSSYTYEEVEEVD
jgi:hypothetical protein